MIGFFFTAFYREICGDHGL